MNSSEEQTYKSRAAQGEVREEAWYSPLPHHVLLLPQPPGATRLHRRGLDTSSHTSSGNSYITEFLHLIKILERFPLYI